MSQTFSPYVTVYDTRQNPPVGELVYRASLNSYLRFDHYTLERPANAVASPNLRKSQLPTAQREQNRQMNTGHLTPSLETQEPISGVVRPTIEPDQVTTNAQKALQEIEPKAKPPKSPAADVPSDPLTDEKPKRPQPRRRAKAAEVEGGTGED